MKEIKNIMSEEFTKNYDFYKEYDGIVIHKENRQIFKANFKNGMV